MSLARFFLTMALLLPLLAPDRLAAQAPVAASGREFYVALPSVEFANGAHALRLNITATNTATVTLSFTEYGTSETVTIGSGQRWERVIPADSVMLLEREYRASRSIRITSTEPVTVNAVNDAWALTDGYLALPSESLGFEYLAASYPGVPVAPIPNLRGGVVAVIATEDDTEVRIVPSVQTKGGNDAGVQFGVTLDRGEIYQIIPSQPAGTDLSGTRITSDRPVAVISGHRAVPTDSVSAYNTLLEQMVPVADWGRTFYTTKLVEQGRGRYRVHARAAGTEVRVNGLRIVTLGAGAVHEFLTDGATIVEASQPVLLVQIGTRRAVNGGAAVIDSDPSMAIVNPTDSYAPRFEWSTPTLAPRGLTAEQSVPWRHWAMITAPTGARNSVRLDGAPVGFTIPYGDGAYWTALVEIQPGPHRVAAAEPVNVQIFGDSHYDAYAMPAGMRLREPFRAAPVVARTCAPVLDTTIGLANFGGVPIEVSSVSFTGGGIRLYPDPPFIVAPGGTRPLGIRIALPGYGRVLDTAIVTTTTSGARPLRIPIDVSRDSLAVEAVERVVVFAAVGASAPTRDTILHVVNRGTGPVVISSVAFTGPFSLVAPALPTTVGIGDTLALTVRFAPPAPGTVSGRATLALAPCGAPVTIDLSGQRLRGAGIDVRTVVVPEVGCGDGGSVVAPVVVRSVGEEPLRFDSIQVRGPGAPAFTVTAPPAGTLIAPGDSIVASLRFTPPAFGAYTIQLRVWNGVSPGGYLLTSPIETRRVGVEPVLSRVAIDFGRIGPCMGDSLAEVTITNRGSTAMRLDRLRTSTPIFIVETAEGFELAPGARAPIAVRFRPRDRGAFADTLRIATSPCDTILEITLTGSHEMAALGTSDDTLELGTIEDCLLPAGGMLRLTNTGDVALDLRDVSIDGAGFRVIGVSDATLAPGETSVVEVDFLGTSGVREGTLRVRAEPCAIALDIPVRIVVARAALELTGSLDFGTLAPNVPSTRTAMLRNTGSIDLVVDPLTLADAVPGLAIIAPTGSFTLPAGAGLPVVVEYRSSAPAPFTTLVRARRSGACPASAELVASGTYEAARTLALSLPDTSGWVDSRIGIPLSVRHAIEGEDVGVVRAEIRWDYTMLGLDGVGTPNAGGVATIVGESTVGAERVVQLEYSGPVPESGALLVLDMRVLVGAAERTPLRIASASVDAPQWTVTTSDGAFTTLGICSIGGGRFIRIAGTVLLRGVSPNPASERLRLALESDASARVTVTLVDAIGRGAAVLYDGDISGGSQDLVLDVGDVPAGFYLLEVRSANQVERHGVALAR